MKIIVSGADGFTGRHVVATGATLGHKMLKMDSDLLDPKRLKEEMLSKKPDAVIHLAAKSFVDESDPSSFHRVNVVGTLNLLEALKSAKIKPISTLIASSANIYGNQTFSPISEDAEVNPINDYAKSKFDMEKAVLPYRDHLGIIITRPFNYTGVGQSDKFLVPKLIHHFKNRLKTIELGNTDIEREFNDVRFVCHSYFKLIENGQVGATYNICTGKPYSISFLIRLLQDMTGHQIYVRKNVGLMRKNEIVSLCGDPRLLISIAPSLAQISIQETLDWMLYS